MKIIHSADIHLGSKVNTFPKDISDARKEELRNSFKRMVDYAKNNDVSAIIISGDLFDSDKPFQKDKDFFFSVVKNNPSIDFYYLRGNHDESGDSLEFSNLKTFSSDWQTYDLGEVSITGVEITKDNATSIYSTLSLDEKALNIVMLHGQTSDSVGVNKVCISKLKDKNIDYLALGHYHSYVENSIDNRGTYAYSGCLEGRGYDETGDKGFVLLEITDKITHTFIPFSERKISLVTVDVSDFLDSYAMYERALEVGKFSPNDIYRVELIGEVDAQVNDFASDIQKYLSGSVKYADVKDRTTKKIDISKYENDLSLKGEFVRSVYKSKDYSDEEKAQIIAYGLKALSGSEVE